MTEENQVKKKQTKDESNAYAALKAKDDVYYQMASIFKAATRNKGKCSRKVLNKIMPKHLSEIFLDNFF